MVMTGFVKHSTVRGENLLLRLTVAAFSCTPNCRNSSGRRSRRHEFTDAKLRHGRVCAHRVYRRHAGVLRYMYSIPLKIVLFARARTLWQQVKCQVEPKEL